jgi:hypothetical protein
VVARWVKGNQFVRFTRRGRRRIVGHTILVTRPMEILVRFIVIPKGVIFFGE